MRRCISLKICLNAIHTANTTTHLAYLYVMIKGNCGMEHINFGEVC